MSESFNFKYSTATHNPSGVLTEIHTPKLEVGVMHTINKNNKRYCIQKSPIHNTVESLKDLIGISVIFSEPTWEPGIRNMFGSDFIIEYTNDLINLVMLNIPCYMMVSKRQASYIKRALGDLAQVYAVEQTPHRVKTNLVVTRDPDFTLDNITSDLDVLRYINSKYKNKIICDPFCGYGEKILNLVPDVSAYYFYDANPTCIKYIIDKLTGE